MIARIEGEDRDRAALLIHGHLDVVPANAADWTVHPFSGEMQDGCVWGRGAVDMKDMDAMTLAVVRRRLREGRNPPRDVVLAFLADEEAGGRTAPTSSSTSSRELFEGVTEAISEVGGFSVTVGGDPRLYLIETAQKGIAWMRLTARGRAGHGSMVNDDNAVDRAGEAVARLGRHTWPGARDADDAAVPRRGVRGARDRPRPRRPGRVVAKLGPIAMLIGATLRNTANPTMLEAGYKVNVIPGVAKAHVDGRFLPGYEEEFLATIDALLGPDVQREFVHHDIALETEFEGRLVDAACAALRAEDPHARPVPYTLSAGTDSKAFWKLGIPSIGFVPLLLPPELDFAAMFHGVDERVPTEALQFGARVLDRFLDLC